MSTTITQTTSSQTPAEKDFPNYSFDLLEPYGHPPETKEDLSWSELVTLDLEDYGRPGGKERLAKQLEHAVHHVGFVCIFIFTNFVNYIQTTANIPSVLCEELWPHPNPS
jgi:hypothetical protein